MTWSGIEPTTFKLVEFCFNELGYLPMTTNGLWSERVWSEDVKSKDV
jgi:hypothetical protein